MKKVPAVAQVRVSLNEGLTVLDLRPGNIATVAELRQIIKNNGFVSKEATAVARGTVAADQKTFVLSGTNERLSLSSAPQRSGDDWRLAIRAPDKPVAESRSGGCGRAGTADAPDHDRRSARRRALTYT